MHTESRAADSAGPSEEDNVAAVAVVFSALD